MLQRIWTYITHNKTVNVLNLVMLLILVLPFYYSYYPLNESENAIWHPKFLITSFDIVFYLPLLILTIGFQLAASKQQVRLLIKLNSIISFLYLIGMLCTMSYPIQDFAYGMGAILVMTLFPLNLLVYQKKKPDL